MQSICRLCGSQHWEHSKACVHACEDCESVRFIRALKNDWPISKMGTMRHHYQRRL